MQKVDRLHLLGSSVKYMSSSDDPDLRELAQEEVTSLGWETTQLEQKMKQMLLPKDPLDERNIVLEVICCAGAT